MNAPNASTPSQAPVVPPPRRLLVVDDEEIVLIALRETLVRAGYEVSATGDAVEALHLLQKQTFAVIITDQQMPRMTGLEFLAQAKEIQPDATRILITAVLNLGTVIEAINKGEIYRFVIKPWLREEFLGAVQSAVQRHVLVSGNAALRAAADARAREVETLASELAAAQSRALELSQQVHRLSQSTDRQHVRTLDFCHQILETYYPTLGSQARRVVEICKAVATELDLSAGDRKSLEIAAWLHDLGLIGLPRAVVRQWELSPATLGEVDRVLIEQHPLLGENLAQFVDPSDAVRLAIRSHHEHHDGTGYPARLSRDAIPWLGRLLGIAVAYAASHHDHGTTVEMIRSQSGTHFDPEVVAIFLRALTRATIPRRQRVIALSELRPGMILAKGIYTANGALLVPDGHQLNESYIDKLRTLHQAAASDPTLRVYC